MRFVVASVIAWMAASGAARADYAPPPPAAGELPPELEGVDLEEHLKASLPTELEFTDDHGRKVRLGELFRSGMPTMLTFNYSNCPLLCSVQLGGLTKAMAKMRRMPGESFRIITIVLDPTESPKRARETKEGYLTQLARAREALGLPAATHADEGWSFLVGKEADIRAVADTVGFHYKYHPGRKEYLHPAVFMMITPLGTVAQYIPGVSFESETLEAAVTSAALGVTTEGTQEFILSCYHYEPPEGFNAFRIMQIVGMVFAALVVIVIVSLHLKSRLSRRPMGA